MIHHPIPVANAAPLTHISLISNIFSIIFITIATRVMLSLDLILPIAQSILKLIWSRKLNIRNRDEYFNISHDFKKVSQKNIYAIFSENINKNNPKNIPNTVKYLLKNTFIPIILSILFLEYCSENTGRSSRKTGQISKKGIIMRLI